MPAACSVPIESIRFYKENSEREPIEPVDVERLFGVYGRRFILSPSKSVDEVRQGVAPQK